MKLLTKKFSFIPFLFFMPNLIGWMTPDLIPISDFFRPGKDYALFFAINTYKAPLTNLHNPITNAREIATELENRYGFKPQVVENPSSAQIEQILRDYANRFARNLNGEYPSNGQLFIFFSGHGIEQLENGFFLAADADMNNLRQTGLAYSYLRPLINAIKCQHILVAVDACYSVNFDEDYKKKNGFGFHRPGELSENDKTLANHNEYKSRVFFTSDAVGDMTPDKSNFAKKLLEGLRTFNTPSGFMTSSELFANFVQKASPTPHGGDFGDDEAASTFLFFSQKSNTLDFDSDGIPNATDQCPNEAGPATNQGCPTPVVDTDGDGVPDTSDQCPYEKGLVRLSGCPDTDNDGVPDIHDHCPEKNGSLFNHGCPNPIEAFYNDPLVGTMIFIEGGPFKLDSMYSFYLAKTEITQAQWRAVMGNNPKNLNFYGCDQCPVEGVSWNEAQVFINRLNAKTNYKYRLPTEAEWLYAAERGQTGKPSIEESAWVSSNSTNKTQPVGQKQLNKLGLADMFGNVWEWCEDWDQSTVIQNKKPVGPPTGSRRVIRGGAWNSDALMLDNTYRRSEDPNKPNPDIGFRLVRNYLNN